MAERSVNQSPKFKKLFEAMEEIFGTVAAPVIDVVVTEPYSTEFGADEEGRFCRHEVFIQVKIDSRSVARRSRAEAQESK